MPRQSTHTLPITAEMMDEVAREFAAGSRGDGETTEEIAERLGISLYKTRKMLKALQKAGRLAVGQGVRQNIVGSPRSYPVYSVRPGK